MKKFISTVITVVVLNSTGMAQSQFQLLSERPNEKTYKGIISRDVLTADTAFKWMNYARNFSGDKNGIAALKKNKDSIQLLVFMGTWCEDSQDIIPKLFSITDAAGFRKKTTLSHLTEALGIINVPTIIVMKNGKEVGRVVEYGKYGMFDKELGEIVNSVGPVSH